MKLKKNKTISWRKVEDEGVLLNLDNGAYYSLNETGLKIWELCDGKNNPSQIHSILASEYKTDPEKVSPEDITRFLALLRREKLAEIAD